MANQRRRSEAALPWLFTRAIDDLDNGPASAFVAYRRPNDVIDTDRRNCRGAWARRHEHDWHTRSTSSLAGDVSRMPRGLAFVLQTFVVLVEYNHRTKTSTRRPHSSSSTNHDIDSTGRRCPLIGKHRNGATSTSQTNGDHARLMHRRGHDEHRAEHASRQHYGRDIGSWRQAKYPASGCQHLARPVMHRFGDYSPRRSRRQRDHCTRRRRRHQERSKRTGPTHARPSRQVDDFLRRADASDLGDSQQLVDGDVWVGWTHANNPAADTATVEGDANKRADADAGAQLVGNEVIELPIKTGDIGNHPGNKQFRRRRWRHQNQAPIAALKSARRLTFSHVNSGNERPK